MTDPQSAASVSYESPDEIHRLAAPAAMLALPEDANLTARALDLLHEAMSYMSHHGTCGRRHGESDCGSYHPPFCRLHAIQQDFGALVRAYGESAKRSSGAP